MISLTIQDTKSFMSHLLIKDTFDNFCLSEAMLATANTYTIDGRVNPAFYTKEEFEMLADQKYSLWQTIKPFCYSLIKGSKVPSAMKFVFALSKEGTMRLLTNDALSFTPEDIDGLFVNLKYADAKVQLVTGTSLRLFTLDKTLEHAFDFYIKQFLDNAGIAYEQL